MKKLLLGLSLDLLLFAVLGATAAAQASTLFSDDYEGAVKWNSTSSNWAIVTAYAHGGTHSAHAPSQAGMVPMMIYGPFDLSTATAATLSFELIYTAPRYYSPPSPPGAACGSFAVGYSTDGSLFTVPINFTGDTGASWALFSYDLNSVSFPLVGHSQVWFAFSTAQSSVFATYSQGAYVDDLTLTATVPDTTPPTTTATGAVDGRWYRSAVTVEFAASDNAGGSGVAYTEYALDGGAWTTDTSVDLPAPSDHSGDLLHTVLYRSVDNAGTGNVEATKTLTVGIDTRKPTTKAPYAASVVRYRTAKLYYKVLDTGPNGGTATVTVKIKNSANKVVKTLGPYKGKAVSRLLAATFICRLAKGSYRFSVYATDAAGNAQVLPAGSNRFTAK